MLSTWLCGEWLAEQAEALRVDSFRDSPPPRSFIGKTVRCAAWRPAMSDRQDGEPKGLFQLGMELTGRYTIFAEAARGELGRQLLDRFRLPPKARTRRPTPPRQELWEFPDEKAEPGRVMHTAGWPMDQDAFGGGFLSISRQPRFGRVRHRARLFESLAGPLEEMQRWKSHPDVRSASQRRQAAELWRAAINNGGPQALPKSCFPGALVAATPAS